MTASGSTTIVAATGAVVVNSTAVLNPTGFGRPFGQAGDIDITGGTSVAVTTSTSNAVNTTVNQSDVDVTGSAATTVVSVVQRAAADASGTVVGVTRGNVTITDGAAATAADTIATVTLANYEASTITSSALSTLNLTGNAVASGILTLNGQSTVAPATALALNLNGGTFDAIVGTQAARYTALNVTGSTAASTLVGFTSVGVTALTVSGGAAVTFTSVAGMTNLEAITSANTAGTTITGVLGNGVSFTGGAGADAVTLAATTETINMGAGNDTVTLNNTGLGAGGTLNGGEGRDTIVMNTDGSSVIADPAITGFEVLRVAGAGSAKGTHNANGFTALELGATAGATTFNNVAAGVGLTIVAAPSGDYH